MTLGTRVRELRELAGLTQDELAEKIGVDRSYIAHIEHGRARQPSPDVLLALARALSTSAADLYMAILGEEGRRALSREDVPPRYHPIIDEIEAIRGINPQAADDLEMTLRFHIQQTRRQVERAKMDEPAG